MSIIHVLSVAISYNAENTYLPIMAKNKTSSVFEK